MEEIKRLIWTNPAKKDLKDIFEFISESSYESADRLIDNILNKTDQLLIEGFAYSGQIDNINPNYRRLIEGNFKILYKVYGNEIVIHGIFDARQSPQKLINK